MIVVPLVILTLQLMKFLIIYNVDDEAQVLDLGSGAYVSHPEFPAATLAADKVTVGPFSTTILTVEQAATCP